MAVLLEILDTAGQVRSSDSFSSKSFSGPLRPVLHILTSPFHSTPPQETFSAMRELYMKNGEVRKHSCTDVHTRNTALYAAPNVSSALHCVYKGLGNALCGETLANDFYVAHKITLESGRTHPNVTCTLWSGTAPLNIISSPFCLY